MNRSLSILVLSLCIGVVTVYAAESATSTPTTTQPIVPETPATPIPVSVPETTTPTTTPAIVPIVSTTTPTTTDSVATTTPTTTPTPITQSEPEMSPEAVHELMMFECVYGHLREQYGSPGACMRALD